MLKRVCQHSAFEDLILSVQTLHYRFNTIRSSLKLDGSKQDLLTEFTKVFVIHNVTELMHYLLETCLTP